MRLDALAQSIGAKIVRGGPALEILGLAGLKDAQVGQLSYFSDSRYAQDLARTQAAAVLLKTTDGLTIPENVAILTVADPELAFVHLLSKLYPHPRYVAGVDPRAFVEFGVELHDDVYVGPFAVIRRGTKIGARAVIHAHVIIGHDCHLGDGCVLHPRVTMYDRVWLGRNVVVHAGAVLGADGFGYKFREGRHVKVPHVGTVEIGDDVEIGANTCIDRAALGATKIGMGTKIDNLVQIGHNVSIGQHCILCGQAAVAGSSGMSDYCVLGGNAGIADHIFMGKGSKAGAKSGIAKNVPPGTEVFGAFAEERKTAFRQLAALRRLPKTQEHIRHLEKRLAELEKNKPIG